MLKLVRPALPVTRNIVPRATDMRFLLKGAALVAVSSAIGVAAVIAWPIGEPAPDGLDALVGDPQVGAYLARAGGCIACHTNPEGGAPLAGGVALDTPFGTLYSPNLTTDSEEGIGNWSISDFAVAVRQGVSPDGEAYYPAFTYPFYADLTDQDIADLWAAFQTVPPNATPSIDPEMSFPFDQRWGLKAWRALYQFDPPTEPVVGRTDEWNRGRWLVEGVTHCAACHTTRNLLGGRMPETAKFAGSDMLPGGGSAPAIDTATLLAEGWDTDSLSYALRTGLTPSGDAFGNAMGEVVSFGTRFLTDDDLDAMAVYLMDQLE